MNTSCTSVAGTADLCRAPEATKARRSSRFLEFRGSARREGLKQLSKVIAAESLTFTQPANFYLRSPWIPVVWRSVETVPPESCQMASWQLPRCIYLQKQYASVRWSNEAAPEEQTRAGRFVKISCRPQLKCAR